MKRLSLVVVVLLAVAAAGCQGTAALTEQDKAAIQKVNEDAVKIANTTPVDFAAYVKLYYADDAEVLIAGMPAAKGTAAIQNALASFPPMTEFKAESVSIDGRGDLAYVRGNYSMTLNPPGAPPVSDKGKYVEVWKKGADGAWKVAYDSFNSDLPVAGLMLPTATMAVDAGPEMKALSPLLGHWAIEGTVVMDAKGSAVPMKAMQGCDWFAGGYAVVCRTTGTMGGATNESASFMYYDHLRKGYVNTAVGSLKDSTGSGRLVITPESFVFTSEFMLEGKPAKDRMTLSNMTPEGGTWKYELSMAGGPYKAAGEGKYTKATQP